MKNLNRIIAFIALIVFFTFGAVLGHGQETTAPKPQEVTIHVVQDAVKPAPVTPVEMPKTLAAKANEWADLGNNVGTAMGSAAKAVLHETKDATFGKDVSIVDGIDKFSKTDAGRFTMFVIGWKVMGKDAVDLVKQFSGIAVGVPILLAWNVLCIWFYRRNFLPRKVMVSKEGNFWNKSVKWQVVNEDRSWTEAKCCGAVLTCATWVVVSIVIFLNVF
jgi:hypothetical protein